MRLLNRLKEKTLEPIGSAPIKIAILGDSVSHGSFQIIQREKFIDTVYDYEAVYHNKLRRKLERIFSNVPVNVINAGISGGNAAQGLERLERDIISCNPDLVIVCFGLNDVLYGDDSIKTYEESLRGIFERLNFEQIETIFMTPNMMNTYVSDEISNEYLRKMAADTAGAQMSGRMDRFMDCAKNLCQKENITVCDCYSGWKRMYELGADVTMLLSNYLNHPNADMQEFFAEELFRTIFNEEN